MRAAHQTDLLSPAEFTLVAIAMLAVLAAVLAAFIRPVPGEQGLVIRRGERVRVATQGLALVLPSVDRVERISLRPITIEPLVVRADTRDGLRVVLTGSAMIRVVDLETAASATQNLFHDLAEMLEAESARSVGRLDLADLSEPSLTRLSSDVRRHDWSRIGVVVDWLQVDSVEVVADERLLTWAAASSRGGHASRR
jgi:regulator of protease activity HflC (stomatin/prohibitin superfamily)